MIFWNVLDLEPTDDIKKIKKAYSQKLKTLDRKNDIEGFQRLHEAYQSALDAAKSGETEASESSSHLVFETSYSVSKSPVEPYFDRMPEAEPSRLALALEQFRQEITRHPEVDWIRDAYERLRGLFSLGRDLLREDLMDSFLHGLYVFLKEHPACADAQLIQEIFGDLHFMQDIKLYEEYEYAISRIKDLVQLEAQRSAWLHRVDQRAAHILLDQDLKAGYRERRQRHVLSHIMDAIEKIESRYPLLIGPYVTEEKMEFWKQIDRSILFTQDDLVNALWGFLVVPGLYMALTLEKLEHVISPTMVIISYPLALIYNMLARRLRFKIQDTPPLRAFLDQWDIRIWTFAINAVYAIGALVMNLQADGHALSVLGLISLFLILIRTMPFGILGCGTVLGTIVLVFVQRDGQPMDLALAAQLGTALFFLLIAAQSYASIFWKRWKPKASEAKPQKAKGPSPFTTRNIVIAIILLKALAALSKLRF